MMRALVFAASVVLAAPTAASPSDVLQTVTCDSVVVPGETSGWRPKRVVLGIAAVPPKHLPRPVPTGAQEWPYWLKSGMVVRAQREPVLVSVPAAWRSRVAIGWGNVEGAAALRFASCPPPGTMGNWNPYAGGFVLRVPTACVPLVFRAGGRSTTMRFGIGKRCG